MRIVFIVLSLLILLVIDGFAQELPAFPGAEGFGKYTTGGRGGRVIYVTTLEDNNSEGSLRYAINQTGARIILFKVSGTIKLKSNLNISNSNVTIAGQTAPGHGITLRDYTVYVGADNVIIRFLRFRLGDVTDQQNDAIWGRNQKNIIIDHCSMSWSTDECASFYDNEYFTLQWSILAESLCNSVHDKGSHGYGGIWGGRKATFHHNLLADNDSRNPRFCGSRYSNRSGDEQVDFRNNVLYNWGSNTAYAGEGGRYNLVNNYYKSGPATKSSVQSRILQPYADDGKNNQPTGTYGTFFVDGNYVAASAAVSNDNWSGVSLHSTFTTYASGITKEDIKSDTEYERGEGTTHSAEDAYDKVLLFAGASLVTDSVDMRVLHDATTGTATFTDGGNGSTGGIIDTQGAVGGWPVLKSETPPTDTDTDGMPDEWETANNLNPNSSGDAQLTTVDGKYPNVEVYINSLVADIVEAQNEGGITTAVDEIAESNTADFEISVYINNASNEFVISHNQPVSDVKIYAVTGQLLLDKKLNQPDVRINISSLKKGIYIYFCRDVKDRVFSGKLIK
ncbi:MAG: T9SS type A sorting domain-containing protein [Draconibacterium sp.]